jgi:hypothetical protein
MTAIDFEIADKYLHSLIAITEGESPNFISVSTLGMDNDHQQF